MLGFVTRILVLALGYAYPAFECYKTVEKNKVQIEELRFWCQYWIIAAMLTIFERVGDIFLAWLPLYGEIKLGLFIYLWYPKTKGTSYVYDSFLRPYVSKHESDIDRSLLELRTRALDLFVFYWRRFSELGQATFFQMLHFLAAQSAKVTQTNSKEGDQNRANAPPPPPAVPDFSPANKQQPGEKEIPTPMPPSPPGKINRSISESSLEQVKADSPTVSPHAHSPSSPDPITESQSVPATKTTSNDKLHSARQRLKRH